MKDIVIAIAHAAFLPERKRTLERLLDQLASQPDIGPVAVLRSAVKEHASVWAQRLWRHCADQVDRGARAVVCLNDDVEVCPGPGAGAVAAQIDALDAWDAVHPWARSSSIVSLHTVHTVAPTLAAAGQRWLRTYHMTGPAYVLRGGAARELVQFFESMPKGYRERINEDNVAAYYAFRRRMPIWNCIPALVSHDVSVPSTLGYEDHPMRRASVPWAQHEDDAASPMTPEFWMPQAEPAFLETAWMPTETLKTTEVSMVLGFEPEVCWFCGERPAGGGSEATGARMCLKCLYDGVGGVFNVVQKMLAKPTQAPPQAPPPPRETAVGARVVEVGGRGGETPGAPGQPGRAVGVGRGGEPGRGAGGL